MQSIRYWEPLRNVDKAIGCILQMGAPMMRSIAPWILGMTRKRPRDLRNGWFGMETRDRIKGKVNEVCFNSRHEPVTNGSCRSLQRFYAKRGKNMGSELKAGRPEQNIYAGINALYPNKFCNLYTIEKCR